MSNAGKRVSSTAWRVIAWVLIGWGVLMLVGQIWVLVSDGRPTGGDVMRVIGAVFVNGSPGLIAWLLLRRSRKRRQVAAAQRDEFARRSASWTERDEVLLHTLHTVSNYAQGRPDLVPAVTPTALAMHYDDEAVVAVGRYEMNWWGRVGDGSYSTPGFVAVGRGAVGLGLVAGSIIGNSIAKSRARARAAADATMTWRPVDHGTISVSNYGFYLTGGVHGYRPFHWSHIVSAMIVQSAVIEFSAETNEGHQTWRLNTDWAEEIFGLWALARNRQHPQWLAGTWYPTELMRARLRYFDKPVPDGARLLPLPI